MKNPQESEKPKISKIDWLFEKNIFANYINYSVRWIIMLTIAVSIGYLIRAYITESYSVILPVMFVTFMLFSIILRKPFQKINSIGFKIQDFYFKILDRGLNYAK